MNEFMEHVRLALDDSINYLTWAFFSLVAAFVFDQAISIKKFKSKVGNFIFVGLFRLYFLAFMAAGAVNIEFIRQAFSRRLDGFIIISNIFWVLILVMIVVNAALVVIGIGSKKKKSVTGDFTQGTLIPGIRYTAGGICEQGGETTKIL
ncbi:hypothetical protein ACFYLB_07765 [Proteus mirabilis]|uniref:hypothetical protein n=1 Tax=Proteus mirabilis TaxID=584 RepID=UPI00368F9C24|nr:hypothetical protein [Proteus mirabilis]